MTDSLTRCPYSDLPVRQCAHCTGDTQPHCPPETPEPPTSAPGVVIWPATEAETLASLDDQPVPAAPVKTIPGAPECRCGRPLRDTCTICDHCRTDLANALSRAGAVADELEAAMVGEHGIDYRASGRSSTSALPWNDRAAEALRNLQAYLATWTRMVNEETGRDLPADTISDLATWLTDTLDWLQQHTAAADAVDEITNAVADGERISTWQRKGRIYLGPCDYHGDTGCPGDVYATEHAPVGACDDCGQGVTVVIRQADLDHDLQSRLLTAADIADWVVRMGINASRETIRKQVLGWHRRGRIHPASHDRQRGQTVPLFRYGDVRPLLAAASPEGI